MQLNHKKSDDYLGQIKNSAEEKAELIVEGLKSNDLPVNLIGKRRILEIGIGGGESMEKIKKES